MSNPASPIRPDQLLQDPEHRLVTDAQITQWNAGGGGTILEMITPIILIERLAYDGRPDDTWAHDTWVQFSYPVGIPSYASSLILNCWLEVQTNDSAKMYMRATNLPQITALWAYGEGTVGSFIEIPYHSSRQFEVMLSGDTTPGFLIEVVGYRRSTVIDALALSNTDPLADGTASPGSSLYVSRADHVHPAPTTSGLTTTIYVRGEETPGFMSGTHTLTFTDGLLTGQSWDPDGL